MLVGVAILFVALWLVPVILSVVLSFVAARTKRHRVAFTSVILFLIPTATVCVAVVAVGFTPFLSYPGVILPIALALLAVVVGCNVNRASDTGKPPR